MKPQYVDNIAKVVKGTVAQIVGKKADRGNMEEMFDVLELKHVRDRQVQLLSGGELQRFAIATCAVQKADCYMFDEPTSYLDVKQRLTAAGVIREIVSGEENAGSYCIVVEHDLAVRVKRGAFLLCFEEGACVCFFFFESHALVFFVLFT
jgi:ATP-binding cassette subfamily E protein 1